MLGKNDSLGPERGGGNASLGQRVHSWLLRLYPRSFRELHGRDIAQAFRLLERDARRARKWGVAALWLREWTVLSANAMRIRLHRRTGEHTFNISRGISEMIGSWRRDIGYALRAMKRSPAFATVVITTLGLGIGINVSVFSVVNGVLLRPLPYHDPSRLQFIWDGLDWVGVPRAWVNPAEVHDLRERLQTFEGLAAIDPGTAEISGDGAPEVVSTAFASSNLFDLLGITPGYGRLFARGDDEVGRAPVAILSHEFWSLRYGSDPTIVGRSVTIDGNPVVVIGVLPRGFPFRVHVSLGDPVAVDVWLPLQIDLATAERGNHFVAVLGRVRPEISISQARAELARMSASYDVEYYDSEGFRFRAVDMHDDLVSEVRPALFLLMGAVGLVLLIAATNIATLLLARAQDREREFAIRRALGADTTRVTRQLVTEGIVLSLIGGALGFFVAWSTTDILVGFAPDGLPRLEAIRVDPVVFGFATGLAILVGLGCGLAPAIQLGSARFSIAFGEIGRGNTAGTRALRLRSVLVVLEFAMSVVLLAGTGLLVQSFQRIQRVDPGFVVDDVLTLGVPLPPSRYSDGSARSRFSMSLTQRVKSMPGVVAAGMTSSLPLTASANQTPAFKAAGEFDAETAERSTVDIMGITPGYIDAVRMTLISGRDVAWSDREETRTVALVDHLLAARFWPDQDPVGRVFHVAGRDVEVVGVVRQARQYRLSEDDRPQVYLPHAQYPTRGIHLAVRGDVGSEGATALASAVRGVVAELDPEQAVSDVATLQQIAGTSLAQRRFTMLMMAAFGLAAMVLSAVGLYGVMGYHVSQRFHEIGLRMALGARRRNVFGLVFLQTARWVGLGLVLGVLGYLGLANYVGHLLYEVDARDASTLGVAALFLAMVACLAAWLPAARAARIDPTVAMRTE